MKTQSEIKEILKSQMLDYIKFEGITSPGYQTLAKFVHATMSDEEKLHFFDDLKEAAAELL